MRLLNGLHVFYATLVRHTLHYLWTALATFVCLPFAVLGLRAGSAFVARVWATGLFWTVFRRVHVVGREHVVPGRRYLVVLNHTSLYDIPALMSVLPRVAWLGRAHLLRIPVFGFVLGRIDYVAVYPGDRARSQEALAQAVAKSPHASVAIFPEGTRTLDGRLGPFKKGFTYLVRDTDLEVLPVTVHGLYSWCPKGRSLMTPRERVTLVLHPPMSNASLRTLDTEEMMRRVRDAVGAGLERAEDSP